jgi:hypothetical protein
MNLSGRLVLDASSVMDMDEVLLAMTASGLQMASSLANISFLAVGSS